MMRKLNCCSAAIGVPKTPLGQTLAPGSGPFRLPRERASAEPVPAGDAKDARGLDAGRLYVARTMALILHNAYAWRENTTEVFHAEPQA